MLNKEQRRSCRVLAISICLMVINTGVFAQMHDNPRVDPGEGRKIYNKHCYYCHGYSGNAKTLASTYLTPPPRDFTSTAIDGLSFESMLQTVRNGRPGTAMKDYAGRLSGREISAVVNYVRNAFMLDKQENLRRYR